MRRRDEYGPDVAHEVPDPPKYIRPSEIKCVRLNKNLSKRKAGIRVNNDCAVAMDIIVKKKGYKCKGMIVCDVASLNGILTIELGDETFDYYKDNEVWIRFKRYR